jgi:hypothetical protein
MARAASGWSCSKERRSTRRWRAMACSAHEEALLIGLDLAGHSPPFTPPACCIATSKRAMSFGKAADASS